MNGARTRAGLVPALLCPAIAALACLLGLGESARAQAPLIDLTALSDLDRAQREIVSVPPERAMPLVLWVGPGEAGGTAFIDFQQDATQLAVIEVEIPADRADWGPIVVPAALPGRSSTVTVSLQMDDGSRDTTVFGQVLGVVDQPLRFGLDRSDDLFILTIGDSSLLAVDRTLAGGGFNPRRQRAGQPQPALAKLDAIPLPHTLLTGSPRLFDAATAVLVGPTPTAVLPEIDRSLAAWVRGGGQLVLPLDQAHDWPITAALVGERVRLREGALELTPEAAREGWTLDPAEPWHATGPVGLGWASVLVGDPQRLGLGPVEVMDWWRQALEPVAEPVGPATPPSMRYGDAVSYEISQLLEIEPPDDLAWIVLGLLVALAVVVGVVDPIVLGKLRLRRLSWLTAGGWIALASVIAWQLPGLVRATRTQAGMVEVIDQRPGHPAQRVGVVTLFADSPMRAAYDDSLGSWWRGISVPMGAVSRASLPMTLRDSGLVPSGPIDAAAFTVRSAMFTGTTQPVPIDLSHDGVRFVARVGLDGGWRVEGASVRTAEGTFNAERLGLPAIEFNPVATGQMFFTLGGELPTALERMRTLDHLAQVPGFALVTLVLERQRGIEAIRPESGPPIDGLERRIVRAIVPDPLGTQGAEYDGQPQDVQPQDVQPQDAQHQDDAHQQSQEQGP